MAKLSDSPSYGKKDVYPYPSHYGSHASMVDETETEKLGDTSLVVCRDEFGTYNTERKRLDTGMADPNRYATSRGICWMWAKRTLEPKYYGNKFSWSEDAFGQVVHTECDGAIQVDLFCWCMVPETSSSKLVYWFDKEIIRLTNKEVAILKESHKYCTTRNGNTFLLSDV